MEIEQRLWSAYKDIYFFVDITSDNFREFCLKIDQFCIITAWNPRSMLLPEEVNKAANHAMENELSKQKYATILVGDRKKSWTEESFVVDLSRFDSTKLAKKYRQNAIYYVQNGQLYLIPCVDHRRSEIRVGCFSQRVVDLSNGK